VGRAGRSDFTAVSPPAPSGNSYLFSALRASYRSRGLFLPNRSTLLFKAPSKRIKLGKRMDCEINHPREKKKKSRKEVGVVLPF
jgi:hypothetical protein